MFRWLCSKKRNEGNKNEMVERLGYLSPDLEHHAEEYECAMMVLDDMNIPREDKGGNTYSLVGRIKLAIAMAKER
jgi:hypothetical protein